MFLITLTTKPQDSTLPRPLRRELHALSGVLHVVDAHSEKIYSEVHHNLGASPISPASAEGTWAPIDRDVLTRYLQARYAGRSLGNADEVATLARKLTESGYRTMRDLELLLERAEEASMRYEADFPPGDSAMC